VVLHVVIDRAGNVTELTLMSGDPMLAESATRAVQQWKYKPFLVNGKPVEVETQVTIKYHM